MATKKPTRAKAKPKSPAPAPSRLQNLAARPAAYGDDALLDEDQLVDASGVFRVTTAITKARVGHDDGAAEPNNSLVMAAQRDNFREPGVSLEDTANEHTVDDETAVAERRQRIATLAARQTPRPRSRR